MRSGGRPELSEALLALVPTDGTTIGNERLRKLLVDALKRKVSAAEYESARERLIEARILIPGKGRGGSVRRAAAATASKAAAELVLTAKEVRDVPRPLRPEPVLHPPKSRAPAASGEAQVLSYRHRDRRKNNPEVGMVGPETDADEGHTRYAYDPHLDPALQFDVGRAQVERLIDEALESGEERAMRAALEELKRLQQPYLNWTGKAERTSFEIDLVSLHVHERIDPASILSAVRRRLRGEGGKSPALQPDLFAAPFESLPLRDAIDFYKHERGWANRLVAGDSLLVMNSLLQKEGMAGQVQMIYIDPPYGIKYGSNFQPFVNKRDVKDRRDEDLTQEPEMIKAFRDTWELGVHSYLAYLRDRLLLARELLSESGSVFVQISDENVHVVRDVLDEILGTGNFVAQVAFKKTTGAGSPSGGTETISSVFDYLVWYARDAKKVKYQQLFREKEVGGVGSGQYVFVQGSDGRRIRGDEKSLRPDLLPARIFRGDQLTSQSSGGPQFFTFDYAGQHVSPKTSGWKTTSQGMRRLLRANRILLQGATPGYVRFIDDFPAFPFNNLWEDTVISGFGDPKSYVVQTVSKVIERCLLMTTDPGDLVLDPTCGSGTTAYVAEKWGRRWITCDTSRVAVTLARQRLMTASYDYYELKYPHEGLKGGFIYRTVPHVTLKSIANNPEIDEIHERLHPAIASALGELNDALRRQTPATPFPITEGGRKGQSLDFAKKAAALEEWEVPFDFPEDWPERARTAFDAFHAARQSMQKRMDQSIAAHADQEQLFDQPAVSKQKLRITGPFTVEAVPFPTVLSLDESAAHQEADAAIARSGISSRHHQWRDELEKTGIRGRGGQILRIADLEALPDTRWLNYSGTLAETGERVVVSFGPEHAALEQRQVSLALTEAEKLRPAPKLIVFAAFTFDPEAAKDIDETRWPGVTLLKAQMNTDLLTEDLKKARASNQSFWLMGQPDVELRRRSDGLYEVEVNGFDYFDTAKGELVSGGKSRIAMWALDTDYDERSLFPRQVFFPLAGKGEGWQRLKKDIRAELNETLLEKYHGTVSLPFAAGDNCKVAVKIVDDRGVESLKIVSLD